MKILQLLLLWREGEREREKEGERETERDKEMNHLLTYS